MLTSLSLIGPAKVTFDATQHARTFQTSSIFSCQCNARQGNGKILQRQHGQKKLGYYDRVFCFLMITLKDPLTVVVTVTKRYLSPKSETI